MTFTVTTTSTLSTDRIASLLVGAFDVVGIVMVTAQFSHPTWMTVLGIGGTIAATAGVGFLLTRGRPRPRPDPA